MLGWGKVKEGGEKVGEVSMLKKCFRLIYILPGVCPSHFLSVVAKAGLYAASSLGGLVLLSSSRNCYWIGWDGIGLDGIGLDWIGRGLDWIGLAGDGIGLDWQGIGLDWIGRGLDWIGLAGDWIGLDWQGMGMGNGKWER